MKELMFPFFIIFISLMILGSAINSYYDCDKKGGTIVKSGITSKCVKLEEVK
jgi:hypothetical protein